MFEGKGYRKSNSAGFSLVEVLIGMAVSLFLLGVLITVFVSNKHAFRVQEGANALQENGRFAMAFLGHAIRMADHWGGIESSSIEPVSDSISVSGPGNCNKDWITNIAFGVQGFDGASTLGGVSQLPNNCIASASYKSNTDLLVLRWAGVGEIDNDALYVHSQIVNPDNKIVGRGVLQKRPTAGAVETLAEIDGTSSNLPYRLELWYVRPCSVETGGTNPVACDESDDEGDPIPTLSRLTFDPSDPDVVREFPIVEGVDDLQLEYGRDVNNDGNVDQFDSAETINSQSDLEKAWSQVISIKVTFVIRSLQKDASVASDYMRKQFVQTVNLRNRARS